MRIPSWPEFTWWLYRERRYHEQVREQRRLDTENPIVRSDAVLGSMTYDRQLRWYQSKLLWNGVEINVSVYSEAPDDPALDGRIESVLSFWTDEQGSLRKLQDCAIRDMLELANDWQADHGPVSAEQFRRRIRITSLAIFEEDAFEAWFADGDLFWGHSILVRGTTVDGPQAAEMHG